MITPEEKEFYYATRSFLAARFPYTPPTDFYWDLFPKGSFEEATGMSGVYPERHRPNGISVELIDSPQRQRTRQRLIFDDHETIAENLLDENSNRTFLISPVGYSARRYNSQNAYELYALTWDLDEPDVAHFFSLVEGGDQYENAGLPRPTYTVLSGHGLHLYYVFDRPIPLFPAVKNAVRQLKRELTPLIWNMHTSKLSKPQYEGIIQGFRMVGGRSKLGASYPVEAWKTGPKTTLQKLAAKLFDTERTHVELKKTISELDLHAHIGFDKAAEQWPEWAARIRRGEPTTPTVGNAHPRIYEWWLRKVERASYGHRYWYVVALAAFAIKCGIPFERLKSDAFRLRSFLNEIDKKHPFTEADVNAALKSYDPRYVTFPRQTISNLTAIPIEPAVKRNHRSQEMHLKIARFTQELADPEGKWRGKQSKEELVTEYLQKHPQESPTQVARALGVSRPTVYKYMKKLAQRPHR